ncbi:cytochrome P450 [Streptomonospora sp. PA3]|uniref:cytochrome P450 family protein n=1 Tax=Streptomonospora sp. PA3 TaxID=2607326 RepID=UPI0012DBFC50|nr:cytochrome P450 [Streptomonospora sp. PA3]MUL42750.1 cytochrome P450 [Streptomonospora sp. PA3]
MNGVTLNANGVSEIDLSCTDVIGAPFAAYGLAREHGPLARLAVPGMAPMWAVLRHGDARAMLTDPRFALTADTFAMRPDVSEEYRPYLRNMGEMEGTEHLRLRRLVAPAFTPRRAAAFRPRIESVVTGLLERLPEHAEGGTVDLAAHFARPLPIEVICELLDIPAADRPRWREYGGLIATGAGAGFAEAVPAIIDTAKAAVAARRADPGDDLVSDLLRAQAEDGDDGDRLSDTELVSLVWNIVLAGQTPANLIANAVAELLARPDQLAALRRDPALMPGAVEELMRWCGHQLLSMPRFAREDAEIAGTAIGTGEPVTAAIAAANRDPRAFAAPDILDVTADAAGQLGFGHGPHFCLGASLARVQTQAALEALLRRHPDLALAVAPEALDRAPDPGTWRLRSLPVVL